MDKRLNLGCGYDYREGYLNVDNAGRCDKLVDLSKDWQLPGEWFEEIVAQDIIEHLPDTVGFMNKCWQIMEKGGKLLIRTPGVNAAFAWTDPQHLKTFTIDTWDFFDATTDFGKQNFHVTPYKWKILSKRESDNGNLFVELEKV